MRARKLSKSKIIEIVAGPNGSGKMGEKENKASLRLIKSALKLFPKVVKEKERAHRENEKVLKNFAPLSRKLKKLTSETGD